VTVKTTMLQNISISNKFKIRVMAAENQRKKIYIQRC